MFKRAIRIISFITVTLFSIQSVCFAIPDYVYQLQITEQNGYVDSRWRSSIKQTHNKTVVIIQDAHENFGAQRNIASILEQLHEQIDFKKTLIGLEGAIGEVDTDTLHAYPIPEARKKVSVELLKQGFLTGVEHAAISSRKNFQLWGLEDEPLFYANYQSFIKITRNHGEIANYLDALTVKLRRVKKQYYCAELQEFDALYHAYQNGSLCVSDYFVSLLKYMDKLNIGNENYPMITLFDEIVALEEKEKGSTNELLNNRDLNTIIKRKKALLNISTLLREIENVSFSIKKELVLEDIESVIIDYERYVHYTRKKLMLQATHEDIEVLGQLKPVNNTNNDEVKEIYEDIKELQQKWFSEEADTFYVDALKRDAVLLNNLLKRMEEDEKEIGIIIVGGFHAHGIEKYLRERDISYVSIKPCIENIDEKVCYHDRMLGNLAPLIPPFQSYIHLSKINALMGAICGEVGQRRIAEVFEEGWTEEVTRAPDWLARLQLLYAQVEDTRLREKISALLFLADRISQQLENETNIHSQVLDEVYKKALEKKTLAEVRIILFDEEDSDVSEQPGTANNDIPEYVFLTEYVLHTRPLRHLFRFSQLIFRREKISIRLKFFSDDGEISFVYDKNLHDLEDPSEFVAKMANPLRGKYWDVGPGGFLRVVKDLYVRVEFANDQGEMVKPREEIVDFCRKFFENSFQRPDGSYIDLSFADMEDERKRVHPKDLESMLKVLGYSASDAHDPVFTTMYGAYMTPDEIPAQEKRPQKSRLFNGSTVTYDEVVRAHTPDYKEEVEPQKKNEKTKVRTTDPRDIAVFLHATKIDNFLKIMTSQKLIPFGLDNRVYLNSNYQESPGYFGNIILYLDTQKLLAHGIEPKRIDNTPYWEVNEEVPFTMITRIEFMRYIDDPYFLQYVTEHAKKEGIFDNPHYQKSFKWLQDIIPKRTVRAEAYDEEKEIRVIKKENVPKIRYFALGFSIREFVNVLQAGFIDKKNDLTEIIEGVSKENDEIVVHFDEEILKLAGIELTNVPDSYLVEISEAIPIDCINFVTYYGIDNDVLLLNAVDSEARRKGLDTNPTFEKTREKIEIIIRKKRNRQLQQEQIVKKRNEPSWFNGEILKNELEKTFSTDLGGMTQIVLYPGEEFEEIIKIEHVIVGPHEVENGFMFTIEGRMMLTRGQQVYFAQDPLFRLIKNNVPCYQKTIVITPTHVEDLLTNVRWFARRKGIQTWVVEKLKPFVTRTQERTMIGKHVVNRATIGMLHSAVVKMYEQYPHSRFKEHLEKYPTLWSNETLNENELQNLLGNDVEVRDDQYIRRELFLMSLAECIEICERNDIDYFTYVQNTPFIRSLQKAGYANIRFEVVDNHDKELNIPLKEIQFCGEIESERSQKGDSLESQTAVIDVLFDGSGEDGFVFTDVWKKPRELGLVSLEKNYDFKAIVYHNAVEDIMKEIVVNPSYDSREVQERMRRRLIAKLDLARQRILQDQLFENKDFDIEFHIYYGHHKSADFKDTSKKPRIDLNWHAFKNDDFLYLVLKHELMDLKLNRMYGKSFNSAVRELYTHSNVNFAEFILLAKNDPDRARKLLSTYREIAHPRIGMFRWYEDILKRILRQKEQGVESEIDPYEYLDVCARMIALESEYDNKVGKRIYVYYKEMQAIMRELLFEDDEINEIKKRVVRLWLRSIDKDLRSMRELKDEEVFLPLSEFAGTLPKSLAQFRDFADYIEYRIDKNIVYLRIDIGNRKKAQYVFITLGIDDNLDLTLSKRGRLFGQTYAQLLNKNTNAFYHSEGEATQIHIKEERNRLIRMPVLSMLNVLYPGESDQIAKENAKQLISRICNESPLRDELVAKRKDKDQVTLSDITWLRIQRTVDGFFRSQERNQDVAWYGQYKIVQNIIAHFLNNKYPKLFLGTIDLRKEAIDGLAIWPVSVEKEYSKLLTGWMLPVSSRGPPRYYFDVEKISIKEVLKKLDDKRKEKIAVGKNTIKSSVFASLGSLYLSFKAFDMEPMNIILVGAFLGIGAVIVMMAKLGAVSGTNSEKEKRLKERKSLNLWTIFDSYFESKEEHPSLSWIDLGAGNNLFAERLMEQSEAQQRLSTFYAIEQDPEMEYAKVPRVNYLRMNMRDAADSAQHRHAYDVVSINAPYPVQFDDFEYVLNRILKHDSPVIAIIRLNEQDMSELNQKTIGDMCKRLGFQEVQIIDELEKYPNSEFAVNTPCIIASRRFLPMVPINDMTLLVQPKKSDIEQMQEYLDEAHEKMIEQEISHLIIKDINVSKEDNQKIEQRIRAMLDIDDSMITLAFSSYEELSNENIHNLINRFRAEIRSDKMRIAYINKEGEFVACAEIGTLFHVLDLMKNSFNDLEGKDAAYVVETLLRKPFLADSYVKCLTERDVSELASALEKALDLMNPEELVYSMRLDSEKQRIMNVMLQPLVDQIHSLEDNGDKLFVIDKIGLMFSHGSAPTLLHLLLEKEQDQEIRSSIHYASYRAAISALFHYLRNSFVSIGGLLTLVDKNTKGKYIQIQNAIRLLRDAEQELGSLNSVLKNWEFNATYALTRRLYAALGQLNTVKEIVMHFENWTSAETYGEEGNSKVARYLSAVSEQIRILENHVKNLTFIEYITMNPASGSVKYMDVGEVLHVTSRVKVPNEKVSDLRVEVWVRSPKGMYALPMQHSKKQSFDGFQFFEADLSFDTVGEYEFVVRTSIDYRQWNFTSDRKVALNNPYGYAKVVIYDAQRDPDYPIKHAGKAPYYSYEVINRAVKNYANTIWNQYKNWIESNEDVVEYGQRYRKMKDIINLVAKDRLHGSAELLWYLAQRAFSFSDKKEGGEPQGLKDALSIMLLLEVLPVNEVKSFFLKHKLSTYEYEYFGQLPDEAYDEIGLLLDAIKGNSFIMLNSHEAFNTIRSIENICMIENNVVWSIVRPHEHFNGIPIIFDHPHKQNEVLLVALKDALRDVQNAYFTLTDEFRRKKGYIFITEYATKDNKNDGVLHLSWDVLRGLLEGDIAAREKFKESIVAFGLWHESLLTEEVAHDAAEVFLHSEHGKKFVNTIREEDLREFLSTINHLTSFIEELYWNWVSFIILPDGQTRIMEVIEKHSDNIKKQYKDIVTEKSAESYAQIAFYAALIECEDSTRENIASISTHIRLMAEDDFFEIWNVFAQPLAILDRYRTVQNADEVLLNAVYDAVSGIVFKNKDEAREELINVRQSVQKNRNEEKQLTVCVDKSFKRSKEYKYIERIFEYERTQGLKIDVITDTNTEYDLYLGLHGLLPSNVDNTKAILFSKDFNIFIAEVVLFNQIFISYISEYLEYAGNRSSFNLHSLRKNWLHINTTGCVINPELVAQINNEIGSLLATKSVRTAA